MSKSMLLNSPSFVFCKNPSHLNSPEPLLKTIGLEIFIWSLLNSKEPSTLSAWKPLLNFSLKFMFVKSPKVFDTLNKLINFKKSDEPIKSDSTSLVTKSSTLKERFPWILFTSNWLGSPSQFISKLKSFCSSIWKELYYFDIVLFGEKFVIYSFKI